MAIPDFQSIMLPLMRCVEDKQEHSTSAEVEALSKHFNLSPQERTELLPSGKQFTFSNRVHWAKAHLKMAGLLENTGRGLFRITERGKEVLAKNPAAINLKMLKTFPEYSESTGGDKGVSAGARRADTDIAQPTPEEELDEHYQNIRRVLAAEVLSKVKECSYAFFEKLVVDLLVKMGYGGTIKDAGKATKLTADEGIDGIIKEDKLGLDMIYIQAKRWRDSVGRPEIQKFVGALAGQGAKKGVFITTAKFSNEAKEYMPRNETKIVLIDGLMLAEFMIDHNVGVSLKETYEVKSLNNDYFDE
jgi:restriction system protein